MAVRREPRIDNHELGAAIPRFLIEIPHDPTPLACTRAVAALLRTGSHFLTHAAWGCKDNEHKAWIIMDFDSRQDALNSVPVDFRNLAKVVQLNGFILGGLGNNRSATGPPSSLTPFQAPFHHGRLRIVA